MKSERGSKVSHRFNLGVTLSYYHTSGKPERIGTIAVRVPLNDELDGMTHELRIPFGRRGCKAS